jgi:hypothetical protein
MRKLLVALLLAFSCTIAWADEPKAEVRYSTFNAVQIANEDAIAASVLGAPNLNPAYIRYLSLHNFPASVRQTKKAIIDLVLNSLNAKYRPIVRTAGLPANSLNPVVLRVYLPDYGIDPKSWDRLAETGSGPTPLPDPYFHTFIITDPQTLPLDTPLPGFPPNVAVVEWTPEFDVDYSEAGGNGWGEVRIKAPNLDGVWFNGEHVTTKTGDDRTYEIRGLTQQKYWYSVRCTGKYMDKDYDVTTKVDCREQRRGTLTLKLPEKPKEAKMEKKVVKQEKILASAPWIALEPDPRNRGSTIANLIKLTNTRNPILRGDWFVTYGTLAPAYYDLIGLPQHDNPDPVAAKKQPKVFLEKDFEKLLKVDENAAITDIVAGIADTRFVTLHNRVLQRFSTVTGVTGGYYWRSQDTDKGIDDEDYLNQIVNFAKPKAVAKEIIGNGRNGLNLYFVADNAGIGLNLAAASVAQHSDAMPCKYQDKQVWVSRNCMLCHMNGMIDVQDKVRKIARDKIALFIADKTKDQDIAKKIEEAFSPDFKPILELDNAKFQAAVKAACGKDPNVVAKDQEELIWTYFDKPVTLDRMAWDAGIPSDKLKMMLRDGINLDYTLTAVLQDPEEPVAVLSWERQGFAALMNYIIGYQPKK